MPRSAPLISLLLGACASVGGPDGVTSDALADEVVAAPGDTGSGFTDARRAVNGVRGGGESNGSLDVFSIGYAPGVDDSLVLGWSDRRVIDVPGPDLVVFENAFVVGNGPLRFMDPAVVEVSTDGEVWLAFPHDYLADDDTRYSADPRHWRGFAGVTPVHLHAEDNPIAPFDASAGGDAFDLADLPGDVGDELREHGVAFVRIVPAASRIDPDTGVPFVRDAASNGPDVDGVYARALSMEPRR